MSDEAIQAEESVVEENEVIEENVEEVVEAEASGESAEITGEESQEEIQEKLEDAIEDGASEAEIKEMIQEFELKVNGKTYNKKIDLNDHEAVKAELQKALAGQQAMQKSSELEKIYQDEVSRLKSDPFSVLEELGLNPDELAEMRIQQRIEEMKKSPEQLAQEQMQKELEEARQKLKAQEERAKDAEFARLQQEAARQLDEEITTALDAHTTLAASPFIVKRVADAMLWAMTSEEEGGGGFENVQAHDVLDTVEREIKDEISSMMSQLPEEVMEAYIGQKGLDKLRQKRLKAVTDTKNISNAKKEVSKSKPEEKKREKISLDSFMSNHYRNR
jgi:hypothetical protein